MQLICLILWIRHLQNFVQLFPLEYSLSSAIFCIRYITLNPWHVDPHSSHGDVFHLYLQYEHEQKQQDLSQTHQADFLKIMLLSMCLKFIVIGQQYKESLFIFVKYNVTSTV
jgi:hypothetical protein